MVAMELGTCRCIGTRPARAEGVGYGRCFESSGVFFTAQPLAHQKAVGCNAQTPVMMEAAPITSFIVMQPELGFQFLVIPLDAPATHDGRYKMPQRGGGGQCAQPVVDGLGLGVWPFNEQPLLRAGTPIMRSAHAQCAEARAQRRVRA